MALLLGATIASTDPATLVPIFRQVRIRDRVAQTVISESAFNDAMGAILTFSVLAVAIGSGEFSLGASLLDLLKQSIIGIVAGIVLGYLAALLIAHEKWAFLAEYAPVVTLVAVIGAYFAADGCRPAASWRYSCSASCSATRRRSASGWSRAKRKSSTNLC